MLGKEWAKELIEQDNVFRTATKQVIRTLVTEAMAEKQGVDAEMIETACAAYWWENSPKHLTWRDLIERDDHRLPIWRANMRAALEAVFAIRACGE